jgi:hypothetical protein
MRRLMIVISVLLIIFMQLAGQVPVGNWRDHLSYNRATVIAVNDSRVYCAAGAGIIVFNKKDNSIEKLSKVNGLSDVDISSIKWSEENNMLLIGYSNGNLDILSGNKINNLSDILRSAVTGSKSINNIMVIGHRAYLSCSFGVVVVDLERDEIADTWYFDRDGIRLGINDMAFDGTHLLAATTSGLYRAELEGTNLLDFSSWTRMDFLPGAAGLFSSLSWFEGNLYAVQMTSDGNFASYIITGESWQYFSSGTNVPAIFRSIGPNLAYIREGTSEIYNHANVPVRKIDRYDFGNTAIRDIAIDNDGEIWIADIVYGLVRDAGGQSVVLTPSGPYSNRIFSISSYPKRTYFAAGGYNQTFGNFWNNGEFSILKNEAWIRKLNYDFRDFVFIKEDPREPENLFIATWGYGLVEYRDGVFHRQYDESNSTLRSIRAGDFIRVGGMAFDNKNNLWVTNTSVPEPISVLKADGEWVSFPYGGLINHNSIGRLIINRLGQKWVLLPRGGGLFVFHNNDNLDDTKGGQTRKFSITDDENKLISNEVLSIAEDHNGYIWVGTNTGIAVYFNPSRVFTNEDFYARRIVVAGGRDGDLGYLLNNESVTAIAIDGANRKWFGTEKSGAFLVSADGTRQLHHFTRQNSPLLSNTVTDISIEPSTGEVFFATSNGVVSFRGDATTGRSGYANVYVFPNPVRENYDGPVTVTGLGKDSIVKITDISGNLIYETVSTGGQAVWDGRNARGRRVNTGIYLIFITSSDYSESHVTKLMFIH